MNLVTNGLIYIKKFIQDGSEQRMAELIEYTLLNDLTPVEIVELANGLAFSGVTKCVDKISPLYDIPSTGGPGSLSTLLTPIILSALGKKVLKLGVPGRPAGSIDCLSQISGYNFEPNIDQLNIWLNNGSYIQILANSNFTPLDILLFQYRKETNNIAIPSLVIASILSKKITFGINNVGLDIRISDFGNFGKSWAEARSNALLFNKVADLLGINSKCFLSNGMYPQQPYFGRGESLLALQKIFSNSECPLLRKHLDRCYLMVLSLIERNSQTTSISRIELKKKFTENLSLQNASVNDFIEYTERIEKSHINFYQARQNGFLRINLKKIRDTLVSVQSHFHDIKFPDPCGIILARDQYDYITKGDIICSFRCLEKHQHFFKAELEECFNLVPYCNIENDLEII